MKIQTCLWISSNICDCHKEIQDFGKENHGLELRVKKLKEIYIG
jgi:hypothetical protein